MDEPLRQELEAKAQTEELWQEVLDYGGSQTALFRDKYGIYRSGRCGRLARQSREYWEAAHKQPGFDEWAEIRNQQEREPDYPLKLILAAAEYQDVISELDNEVDSCDIALHTQKPIGISFTADWHMGAGGTDHRSLLRFVLQTIYTPGIFTCNLGDSIDGFVAMTPDTGRYDTVMRPRHQKSAVHWLIRSLRKKLLAYCGGQHEFFSERLDDFNIGNWLAREGDAVSLGAGGTINLRVGEEHYSIACWHKYRGNSIYDPTASARRLFREHGPFDISATADKHNPAISKGAEQGRYAIFVQAGTFKLRDGYAKSLGYTNSDIGCPMAILWPDEHRFEVVEDWELGLQILASLRGEEANLELTLEELVETYRQNETMGAAS